MWGRLSTDEQTALLTLSAFPSFTLAQSEYMTAPYKLSEAMLRENPFIRFDREICEFYMHSILKNYLCERFDNTPQSFITEVYLYGGDWFAQTGSYIDAMQFYHRAGAYERL